jgi:hypothetical protein
MMELGRISGALLFVSAATTAASSSGDVGKNPQALADPGRQYDGVAVEVTGTDASGAARVFYGRECTDEEARAGALSECEQAGAHDCHVTSAHTMYCRFLCLCE